MAEIKSGDKNVRNDEIDLLDLFRNIGTTIKKWLIAIARAFLISIVFLIRRWLPLLISLLAAVAIAALLKTTSKSFYTSDLVFRNNLVSNDKKSFNNNSELTSEMISKINKLHSFCEENNFKALAESVSMDPSEVTNIKDLSAYWIIDMGKDGVPDYVDYKGTHNVYDTLNVRMRNTFDVRVNVISTLDLRKLRDGIIKYIEGDSLYRQRNNLRLRQNNELLSRLGYDIKQLDSLQKVKYFEETRNMKPVSGGQIIFMQEQKTQLVYEDIYDLYAKKQTIESELNLYKGIVSVLSDFSAPIKRNNGFRYYANDIVPVFLILTLIGLIIHANAKRIRDIMKKY